MQASGVDKYTGQDWTAEEYWLFVSTEGMIQKK